MTAIHQESPPAQYNFDVAKAVQEQRIRLNMSQLMGCDYIFITPHQAAELFGPTQLAVSLREIIQILEVNPRQTLIILIDDNAQHRFTRLEYTWNQGNLEQIIPQPVNTREQIEFMEMMLDCSTLY